MVKFSTIWMCVLVLLLGFTACNTTIKKPITAEKVAWKQRSVQQVPHDAMMSGSSYLPVYSQIYQLHQHKTYNLTVTVSMRNVSPTDTIYLLKADYFDASGALVEAYLQNPVYIAPLETLEIVIDENSNLGGTGGNFIFDWLAHNKMQLPLFEAIMISTTGQQGLSFTTRAVRITE